MFGDDQTKTEGLGAKKPMKAPIQNSIFSAMDEWTLHCFYNTAIILGHGSFALNQHW